MQRLYFNMFSSRLNWQLTPNPLTQLLEAKRANGETILDLTESNPTRAGFDYGEVVTASAAFLAAPTYHPTPRGLLSAREAITNYYAQKHKTIHPDSLFLTASTSEAYSYLFKLLGNAGDEILVPQPSYPLFEFLAGLESLSTIHYPLSYYHSWQINFEVLEQALSPKTKALVVVNPNNPTGSYLKHAEWQKLNELCLARNIALIVDEVFADYANGADESRVETVVGSEGALTFALSGFSKVVALPQMKLGWIQVSGEKRVVAEVAAKLELIADTYLSVVTGVQQATPFLLSKREHIQKQIQARVQSNEALLRESGLNLLKREGGWYAVVEVAREAEDLCHALLAEANVLLHPGYFYDFRGRNVVVLSLLTPPQVLAQGIEAGCTLGLSYG